VIELSVISEPPQALFDVIFVHGLGGNARGSWSSESGYWPEWVANANPSARVSAVSYSYILTPFRSKSMTISNHATALLELLTVNDVGTRPLVFVAHSLGGVVVKEFLRQAATMKAPSYRSIWDQTAAVVFLATPVALSSFAQSTILKLLGVSVVNDAESRTLDEASEFYREQAPRKGITTLSFAAASSVLVAKYSADPGVPDAVVVPLDGTDVSVAKPESRSSLVVVSVQRLLENVQGLIVEHRLPTGSIGDDPIA
jgi:protein SERAC1